MSTNYILSGPVKSGKSTRLFDWIHNQSNVSGILSLLIDGKKHLYSISDKEEKCLETSKKNALAVGRYFFDPYVFEWAQKKLINEMNIASRYLIIDEIGYLELEGKGLEPTLSMLIKASQERDDITLLLVVRESLVDQIIEQYKFDNIKIIKSIDWLT